MASALASASALPLPLPLPLSLALVLAAVTAVAMLAGRDAESECPAHHPTEDQRDRRVRGAVEHD